MAKLLVKAREFGDESVADVAQRTGISRSTLHRLAAGTKQPSLATLWTLRDAYQLQLDMLVYDDPLTVRPTVVPRPRPAAAGAGRGRARR
ncbi:helix-turn-helix domain-containing protein [Streptomyces nodosus]|nr:helix-turn-helix transcriptional regulator [Streptomyces nodosus]MBB4790011.1 transcriptional regulator with XRE-family HTH domain [Streptomyces nodosus]